MTDNRIQSITSSGTDRHEHRVQSRLHSDLDRVKKVAHFLDKQIPLPLGMHIGADGLIGLIPGVGDLFGAGVSFWLIGVGRRYHISKYKQSKMLVNILIDTILGAIPLVGDIFDFAWKSNVKNAKIIADHLEKQ